MKRRLSADSQFGLLGILALILQATIPYLFLISVITSIALGLFCIIVYYRAAPS